VAVGVFTLGVLVEAVGVLTLGVDLLGVSGVGVLADSGVGVLGESGPPHELSQYPSEN